MFRLAAWCSWPSRIPVGMDLEIIKLPVTGDDAHPVKQSLVYPVEISCSALDKFSPADAPRPHLRLTIKVVAVVGVGSGGVARRWIIPLRQRRETPLWHAPQCMQGWGLFVLRATC